MVVDGCSDYYHENDTSAIYVLGIAYFVWWAIHLFLETYCNMGPVIRRTISLQEMQDHIDSANKREMKKVATQNALKDIIDNIDVVKSPKDIELKHEPGTPSMVISSPSSHTKNKSSNIFLKLTKSLDDDNQYRIRQSAAFLFTKFIFRVSLLLLTLVAMLAYPSFVADHFWHLNSCTTYLSFYQYSAALIFSAYSWECAMLAPYAKVKPAIYFHHWFTVLAAANILYGLYSPLATNYGILHIALNITSPLTGAFRFQFASRWPDHTRRLATFAAVYMIFLIILSWIFGIVIIARCFYLGFDTHDVPLWSIIMYIITMVGWSYDDYTVVQTYWAWGLERYEDADFDMNGLERLATGRVSTIVRFREKLGQLQKEFRE